ncbi:MAG: hypothetical protein M0C28_16140 [Candidatus Moduliflexus flocculans]|nr:hypothetical protein [Candidatus Moduliflexus flocculans]
MGGREALGGAAPRRGSSRVALLKGRKVVAVGGDTGSRDLRGRRRRRGVPRSRPSIPGAASRFPRVPPAEAGRPLHGLVPASRSGRRTSAARGRGSPGGMVEDTQVFHLDFSPTDPDDVWAATLRLGLPDDRRGRDAGNATRKAWPTGRTHVVGARPARPLAGPRGNDGEPLREPRRRAAASVASRATRTVVNGLLFDPAQPGRPPRGDGGGGGPEERGRRRDPRPSANAGLSEARVPAVAVTASGVVVVVPGPRTEGAEGLWALDPATGKAGGPREPRPPATVRALLASGERLLAGTPDGLWLAPGGRGGRSCGSSTFRSSVWPPGAGRLFAATDAGAFESRDGGGSCGTRRRLEAAGRRRPLEPRSREPRPRRSPSVPRGGPSGGTGGTSASRRLRGSGPPR